MFKTFQYFTELFTSTQEVLQHYTNLYKTTPNLITLLRNSTTHYKKCSQLYKHIQNKYTTTQNFTFFKTLQHLASFHETLKNFNKFYKTLHN